MLQRGSSTAVTLYAIRFSIINLGFNQQNERRLLPFWSSVMELHAACSLGEKRNSHIFSRKGSTMPLCQNHNPNEFRDDEGPKTIKTSQKLWINSIANSVGWSRNEAVANFRLATGYDCLANQLDHLGLGYFLIH